MTGAICGGTTPLGSQLSLDAQLDVGFGMVKLCVNGDTVYSAPSEWTLKPPTVRWAENLIQRWNGSRSQGRRDGLMVWTLEFIGPMSCAKFGRFKKNLWLCIDSSPGFA